MIKNYDEIQVLNDSLIILDLDETIIHFKPITSTWWNDTKKILNDANSYKQWLNIISSYMPYLLDENEFLNLLQRIEQSNSILIILTARDKSLCHLTMHQIVYCNIPILPTNIYFSDKKGMTVYELKRVYKKTNVIFVDDKLHNVNDVKKWNPTSICYHIQHIKLM